MKKKSQLSTFNPQFSKGFTLIEMLVALFIFAIVGILSTQSLALSLRGSKKSEKLGVVRENVDYAMNVIERALRTAQKLNCSPLPSDQRLDYLNQDGESVFFECVMIGGYGYIDSSMGKLTSSDVNILECPSVFNSCATDGDTPDSVEIVILAEAVDGVGADGARYRSSTKILLRNY